MKKQSADGWEEHWEAWEADAIAAGTLPAKSMTIDRLRKAYRDGYSDGQYFFESSKTLEKLNEIEAKGTGATERRTLAGILELATTYRDNVNSRLVAGNFQRIIKMAEDALEQGRQAAIKTRKAISGK